MYRQVFPSISQKTRNDYRRKPTLKRGVLLRIGGSYEAEEEEEQQQQE